ncbi:MAG: hypothetical protein ACYSTX_06435 [Planctomycetota bacterium]|jgi:hypothetical protein
MAASLAMGTLLKFLPSLMGNKSGGDKSAGSGLALAIGAGKSIAGSIKKKKAEAMTPQVEDPEERALASYAARRKRAFQTGTAMASQRAALQDAMKVGIDKSFKVGGGAKGLNMMSRMFNQQMLGTQDKALQGEMAFAGQEKDIKSRMSQRELELGLLKRAQKLAEATQLKKEGKSMFNLGLAKATGIGELNPYGTGGQQSGTTGSSTGATVTNEKS